MGVTLSRGLTIEAGAATMNGVKFGRCERDGCYVEMAITPATIEALSTTTDPTQLSMFAYGQAEPLQLPFSVNGFADAVARMREEAVERAVPLEQ